MAYRIKKKILLSAPREKVWLAYRDRLVEIGKSMPAVENISVIEREEKGQKVHLENCWKITGNLPRSVRKFMPENLLTYTDKAIWDENKMICYYEEEPADGSGLYFCTGKNIFVKENIAPIFLLSNVTGQGLDNFISFLNLLHAVNGLS